MDEQQVIIQASSVGELLGVGVVAWGVRALSTMAHNLSHIAAELTAIRKGLDLDPPEPAPPAVAPPLPLPRVA